MMHKERDVNEFGKQVLFKGVCEIKVIRFYVTGNYFVLGGQHRQPMGAP